MSLHVRLALLLVAVVTLSLLIGWVVTGRAVLGPFAERMRKNYIDHVIFLATEVERGADPDALGERLDLDVRLFPGTPRFARRHNRRRRHCERIERRGYDVVACRGPRAPVAVRTDRGWLVVRRDLDPGAPIQRTGRVLIVVAILVIGASIWVASIVTKPMKATVRAMDSMAQGDLSHRLPESGGRELADVARAFNAMADRIDGILRAERELMAGISHELRTPLARLRLETEILRDQEVPGKRLDAMEADLEQIDELIGELLSISRMSLGQQKLAEEPVDLKQVVEEALERTPLPRHRAVVLGKATQVTGDRAKLVRVVGNLIQNAGKYAPADTEVRIALEGTSIEVADQGPGVEAEDLPHLFEPFYRSARVSKATGLGLGLMIAKRIVELHGGRIEARNRTEGGLAIRFEIPPAP